MSREGTFTAFCSSLLQDRALYQRCARKKRQRSFVVSSTVVTNSDLFSGEPVIIELKGRAKNGSPEKSFVSRKVAKTQRKISGFHQENMAETPLFSLFSLSSLLISTFFQWSQE